MEQNVPAVDIGRVSDLSAASFETSYVARGLPVILMNDRAVQRLADHWTLDYLSALHPDHEVLVERIRPEAQLQWDRVRMRLAHYVERIRSAAGGSPEYYLAETSLAKTFPRVVSEVETPAVLAGRYVKRTVVFAGLNTFTGAHYHGAPYEALLTQIQGTKQVSLYSSRQFDLLKPHPWYSTRSNWSQLPAPAPACTHVATAATEYRCTLQAGEMLFIPQGWFHTVRGRLENISITYFFRGAWRHADPRIALRDAASQLHSALVRAPVGQAARIWARCRQRVCADPTTQETRT